MKKIKRTYLLLISVFAASIFTACSPEAMTIDINYSDSHLIESDKLSKFDVLNWSSSDESIAAVEGGSVTGNAPGTAVITASNEKGKVVGEYTVNVNIVPVTNIVLSTNRTEIAVDDGFQLTYSLFPDNASDYGITWRSADDSIAGVNESGYILAKTVGQTTISAANADGVMATCEVTVKKAAPDFKKIALLFSSGSWISYGDDYLTIDTNPYDLDDFTNREALSAIEAVNKSLGLPEYVYKDMLQTTWSQGKQTYTGDGLNVNWSYHPDKGLEVRYGYTG